MKNKKVIIVISIVVLVIIGLLILQVNNINKNNQNNNKNKTVTPSKDNMNGNAEIDYKEGTKLSLDYDYIEFDIKGNNTEDIIYDINIKKIDGNIEDNKIKFTLMKKTNNSEFITVVDSKNYEDITSYYRMYIDVLPKGGNKIHTYRLSMKVDNKDKNTKANVEIKVNGNVTANYKPIG